MAAMASVTKLMGGAVPLQTGMPGVAQLRRVRWTSGSIGGAGARSVVRALLQEGDNNFGARNPNAGEIGSNFGENILGNMNTEHIIMVPTLTVLRLSERAIEPLPEGAAPLTEAEAKALLRKVVGWRVVNQGSSDGAGLKLQCDWILKDSDSVDELRARIAKVAEAVNYEHEIQTLENNKVRVEVWTSAIGGLSENDFIFASKIDQIETKDLTRKLRTWF